MDPSLRYCNFVCSPGTTVPNPFPHPRLTVWVLVSTFPVLTTTFLLRRIQGLVARGFAVHLLAEERNCKDAPSPEDLALMPLVRWAFPEGKSLRSLCTVLSVVARHHPGAAWQAWNMLRFRNLTGLRLLAMAAAVHNLPRPDVVLACFGPMGELACGLRSLGIFEAPIATSFHGVDAYAKQPSRLRLRYRQLRQRGDLFLPVSRHMAARLCRSGLDARRMRVLHTPIRCGQFPWRAPRQIVVGEQIRILGLGRFTEKKGFADSVRVIAVLAKAGYDVCFDLYGDGRERSALEHLARELGIAERVILHGRLPHAQVITAYANSHLFLSTNRMAANGDCEGIPNTVKEAMAMGLPVVATRHSGTPELISDGVHGLLADEGDVVALATACRRMIDDREQALRCAQAARKQVEALFDEGPLNDQLARLLSDLAHRRAGKEYICVE